MPQTQEEVPRTQHPVGVELVEGFLQSPLAVVRAQCQNRKTLVEGGVLPVLRALHQALALAALLNLNIRAPPEKKGARVK